MANEHSVRVSAKGEFGQLNRGLKQLQGDLRSVLGEIDKGARKGGIFDDTSLRALTLYRDRFKSSMDELNREFEKQNRLVDELHEKMKTAYRSEREDLRKQIELREKEMDAIRRQLFETEKLYKKRNEEAGGYQQLGGKGAPSTGNGGAAPFGMGGGMGIGGGLIAKMLGGVLGMAGIAGIGAMANKAYQGAYESRVTPLDLAQRVRGQDGWGGDAYSMWNKAYDIGTSDKMGYTTAEAWNFQDMYSREAGTLGGGEMEHLLKFGRAYGLNTTEVAGGISANRELGGAETAAHFADMAAASAETSGMQPRILEVMETSAGLLANLNTTLKDSGSKQILAYQTVLDTIGNEQGMMGLTGKSGANIISGLGGIFDPGAEQWKFMGMQALQGYDPDKYGDMGLYDLERSFEDGLLNDDNLPAMAKYLREASGGDEQLEKRMLQKWLQDGGYNATKTQVDDLYGATDGMNAFSEENMRKVQSLLDNGDATAPYEERMTEIGQEILDVNSRFDKQMEELGQPLLEMVTGIKEGITSGLEWFTDNEDISAILQNIYDFMGENWKTLASLAGLLLLGGLMMKGLGALGAIMMGVGALTNKGFGATTRSLLKMVGLLTAVGGLLAGAAWLSNRSREMQAEAIEKRKEHLQEGFGLTPEQLEEKMKEHGVSSAHLLTGIADPKYAAMIEDLNKGSFKADGSQKTDSELSRELRNRDGGYYDQYKEREVPVTDRDVQQFGDWINGGMKSGTEEQGDMGALDLGEVLGTETGKMVGFADTNFSSMYGAAELNFGEMFGATEDIFGSMYTDSTKIFDDLYGDSTDIFGDMFEDSSKIFGDMFDTSAELFGDLADGGMKQFEDLYKDGSAFLGGVFDEHSGFKDFFAGLWENFASELLAGMGVAGDTGFGGGTADGSYDVRTQSGVSASKLNSQFGGKLSGMGEEFVNAGKKYGIDPAVLAAIAMHETGNGTSNAIKTKNNVGGMMKRSGGLMSFDSVQEGIDAMASNLKRLYIDQGITTISDIQKKYAPNGAANDPTGLNSHWVSGVTGFLQKLGVGGSTGAGGGGSVFQNWESKITSRYGAQDSVRGGRAHSGLDIDGNQGDALHAVVGGIVSKVFHDDGSARDKDGKANSTSGGSTVMVKMPDGSSYAYAHLSAINPALREGAAIAKGDWIGNMGGDKGKPGSGYSTTGSHLHLGYYDKNGNAKDPYPWLKRATAQGQGATIAPNGQTREIGELDLSQMDSGYSLDLTNRSLGDVIRNMTGQAPLGAEQAAVASTKTLNVNVQIEGGGAKELNNMTRNQLKNFVTQILAEKEAHRLATNPTTGGW